MSKKKKKRFSDEPKKKGFLKKKHKRLLTRLFLLVVVGGSGLVLWKPDLVKDDAQRERVLGMRTTLLEVNTVGQEKILKQLANFSEIKNISEKLPDEITIGSEEIDVDQALSLVSSQLETLTAEQYRNFKAYFCADLVATASAQIEREEVSDQ